LQDIKLGRVKKLNGGEAGILLNTIPALSVEEYVTT
jgi:hypothetical protein